jgi:FKBP-type peptidyl-prolyl cis-trans isomerase
MKVGAKWKLFVPSDLAYGEHPIHSNVGPNAVLLFEIELLEIVE